MAHTSQTERFGRIFKTFEDSKEYLTLHFSPSASARQERWRNYGLSADFLGDYFSNFFPGDKLSEDNINQRDMAKSAISFIANELLENAIKYNEESVQEPISISLYLYEDHIVFKCVNYADSATVEKLREFVQAIVEAEDVDLLFAQQLEKTATGTGDSNMGFLTMMCDYNVDFSWQLQPLPEQSAMFEIQVIAYLKL